MSNFFSRLILDALYQNPNLLDGQPVRLALFSDAPRFSQDDARYVDLETVADLEALPGWREVVGTGYPFTHDIVLNTEQKGQSVYALYPFVATPAPGYQDPYPFTDLAPSDVQAIAVYLVGSVSGVTNPLIFVTNTPMPRTTGHIVLADGDSLTSQPDYAYGTDPPNRWLFSWALPDPADTSTVKLVKPVEGPLSITKGMPKFEAGHTQHVWLFPQRANMIANPNFELAESPPGQWGSNGSITRISGGGPGGGAWAGQFSGIAPIVAESNRFPVIKERRWTVQLMARGTGTMRIGLVYWDSTFEQTAVDWGPMVTYDPSLPPERERWLLNETSFVKVATIRNTFEGHEAMLRVEASGDTLVLDRVLVESGVLTDWPYFDGNTTYGARGDFSWYAGQVGKSYSLWYNNKTAVIGRLFAWDLGNDTLITDEEMAKQGFVYQWVPAGVSVVPHYDVLYAGDPASPLPARASDVLPYQSGPDDMIGVPSPWE